MSAKRDFHAYMYGMRLGRLRMARLVLWAWWTGRLMAGFGFDLWGKQYVVVVKPQPIIAVASLFVAWALVHILFTL